MFPQKIIWLTAFFIILGVFITSVEACEINGAHHHTWVPFNEKALELLEEELKDKKKYRQDQPQSPFLSHKVGEHWWESPLSKAHKDISKIKSLTQKRKNKSSSNWENIKNRVWFKIRLFNSYRGEI